jgi:hypothetical protein
MADDVSGASFYFDLFYFDCYSHHCNSLMSSRIGGLSRLQFTGQFIDCTYLKIKNINKPLGFLILNNSSFRCQLIFTMTMQQYCLRWNNHQPNFISVFSSLLNSESLVDVTLAAEGRHLQAHKVVLSACSSYFQSLFTINPCQHPIVILKDVKFTDLKVMVDFMYYGEVNVSQEQLPHILKTAEMLKIKGKLLDLSIFIFWENTVIQKLV